MKLFQEKFYGTMVCVFLGLVISLACGTGGQAEKSMAVSALEPEKPAVKTLEDSLAGWPKEVKRVMIRSSVDSTLQACLLWAPEDNSGAVPLVVDLHTWSGNYTQDSGVEYFRLARERGWAYIHPNFRGANGKPESTGSEIASEDIVDAVNYMKDNNKINSNKIYLVGASGGGHMSILTAARHPEIWAAVSSWVPITHLALWHGECFARGHMNYAYQMERALGGPPVESGAEVDAQYTLRSPLPIMKNLKGVAVEISAGIHDGHGDNSVPVSHTLLGFNVLADVNGEPGQRVTPEEIDYIVNNAKLPPSLKDETVRDPAFGSKKVLLRRNAGPAMLTLFEGGHEGIPAAAFDWFDKH